MAEAARRWQKNCPLCRLDYVRPKILDCKHSFCLSCLETVLEFWQEADPEATISSLPCPRCRKAFTIPEKGLKYLEDNEYIVGLSSASPKRHIFCLLCEEENIPRGVTALCKDCNQMYCKFCRKIHDGITAAEHDVVVEIKQEEATLAFTQVSESAGTTRATLAQFPAKDGEPIYAEPNAGDDALETPLKPRDEALETMFRGNSGASAEDLYARQNLSGVYPGPAIPPRNPPHNMVRQAASVAFHPSDESVNEAASFETVSADDDNLMKTINKRIGISRREVKSLCGLPGGSFVALNRLHKVLGSPSNQLTMFDQNGHKQSEHSLGAESTFCISVAAFEDAILVANRVTSKVYRHSVQREDVGDVREMQHLKLSQPVLSKPIPGHPVHIIGENPHGKHEVKEVKNRNTDSLSTISTKEVAGFDVSKDGNYFAVICQGEEGNNFVVDVFRKGETDSMSGYEGKGAKGDICFYTSPVWKREVLAVADNGGQFVIFLDHKSGCDSLGKVHLPQPVCLTKDEHGNLLLACEGSKGNARDAEVVVFQCYSGKI